MENQDRTQEMYNLVEQWQQSGLSQKQFSRENNIKLATFGYWVKKHKINQQGETGFARVELGRQSLTSTLPRIEIGLGDGLVIKIY